MKTVSPAYITAVSARLTYLCRLFTLTLFNGEVIRYTDLDRDVFFNGFTFTAGRVYMSAVRNSLAAGVGNATVTVPMQDDGPFPEELVRAGILDNAKVRIEKIDYRHPEYGSEHILTGRVGGLDYDDGGRLDLEILSLGAALGTSIGEVYSQECRNDFGDEQCRYPVLDTAEDFTVTDPGTDQMVFTISVADKAEGHWNFGTIVFTSGLNDGFAIEVALSGTDGLIVLPLSVPYPLQIGDTGTITRGCNFTLTMCHEVWGNTINYRGEPHVPRGDEKQLMVQNTEAEGPPPLGAGTTNTGTSEYAASSGAQG